MEVRTPLVECPIAIRKVTRGKGGAGQQAFDTFLIGRNEWGSWFCQGGTEEDFGDGNL